MKVWLIETIQAAPTLATRVVPVPAKGESLVREMASGLNSADLLIKDGMYQASPPPPCVPRLEFAGTVEDSSQSAFGEYLRATGSWRHVWRHFCAGVQQAWSARIRVGQAPIGQAP